MNKKILLITTFCVVILCIGIIITTKERATKDSDYREVDFIAAITNEMPALLHNNTSVIDVVSIQQFERHWYVVTIKSSREDTATVPIFVLLTDSKSPELRVILGPDSYFTETEMLQYNIPDSVIRALQEK